MMIENNQSLLGRCEASEIDDVGANNSLVKVRVKEGSMRWREEKLGMILKE